MANHIPQGIASNATGNQNTGSGDFPPPYIFADGATVNFKVHAVSEATKEMKFDKGNLLIPDCEVWEFQIILRDDQGNSNFVYHKVVKDGRAWNVADKNGNPWIQNKFINMCTGMGLRQSKEPVNINPTWFSDVNHFTDVIGTCSVDKYTAKSGKYAGQFRNSIGWFLENEQQQPAAPVAHMNTLVDNGVDIVTFNDPAAVEVNPIDDLPF